MLKRKAGAVFVDLAVAHIIVGQCGFTLSDFPVVQNFKIALRMVGIILTLLEAGQP